MMKNSVSLSISQIDYQKAFHRISLSETGRREQFIINRGNFESDEKLAARGSQKKLLAERFLERTQLRAEGRLRQMQLLAAFAMLPSRAMV